MIRIEQVEHQKPSFTLNIDRSRLFSGITLLVGANGAGKTTLLELLSTVRIPEKGKITYQGMEAASHLPLIRSQIGYVPSEIELYGGMTAEKLLRYLAELKGVYAPSAVRNIIADFRLGEYAKTRIRRLSQGQQRRIALAQSLLAEPRFLFLDEPLNGLDAEERKLIIAYLVRYAAERIVVACVHELNEWEAAADRVIWLENGTICFEGSAANWKRNLPLKVWTGEVSADCFKALPLDRMIHFRPADHSVYVRFAAYDAPAEGLDASEPTLEDAFFIRRMIVKNHDITLCK
ncbi:ABC transporter ATP-binding protein [Paenibacillus caui]|uniref:ATP-binding cassette domain-containing protein n=1 Tax=Paenibacillus caui TaxID=2873927 RepID=UPI001CA81E10|nr:ABC transporter ATP-binding protein [Paenibacillus caui]